MNSELLDFLENIENFDLKNTLDEELSELLYSFQKEINALLDSEEHEPKFLRGKLPGKVSKGNNHYGYPYQVLDYPAYISREASFSFRTSIWYGNYFSFSLILTGHYIKDIALEYTKLIEGEYLVSFESNVWETDTSKQQVIPCRHLDKKEFKNLLSRNQQVKVIKQYSLNQTPQLIRLGVESFKSLLIQ